MKTRLLSLAALAVLGIGGIAWLTRGLPADFHTSSRQAADDPAGMALLGKAHQMISAYHAGQPRSNAVLRVVYFHPSDREPLPDYAERLDRVMNDVSDFYRDGLLRFGIANEGLPLERKDGRLLLHVVRGQQPAKAYSYASGDQTQREIRVALKDVFDMDREHVLMIYGLCRQEPDARYVFDAPYYGGGSQRNGICHAADCELMDPRLLTETGKEMVFTEHYHPRMEVCVAVFNTMYIGGLAHELGHGLGLPHDAGTREEAGFGSSLMGIGNLHYRSDLHGGKKPAYLARTSALLLASHPLFTRSDHGRWDKIEGGFEDLQIMTEGKAIRLRGKVTGTIPAYAVAVYVWRARETDHSARTFPAVITDGSFDVLIDGLRPDSYKARITAMHVNGGVTRQGGDFGFNADGQPVWPWVVGQAEKAVLHQEKTAGDLLTDQAIARASTADQRLLRILRGVLEPAPLADLATVTGDKVSLADVRWETAQVGWGKPARNHLWFDEQIQDGVFLKLGGEVFQKGLYAHSASRYVFDVDGRWRTFTATLGLCDGAPEMGSAVFRVLGDGQELWRSDLLRPSGCAKVNLDITGVKKLELIAEGGEGHVHGSWAIWAEPTLSR